MNRMRTLQSSKLFSHLSEEELGCLQSATQELNFADGQEIFREGDPGDGVYVVQTGAVVISAVLAGGERQVLNHVLPGDVFGEMTLIDQHPRSANASAQGPTVVFFVPREPVVALLRRSPDLCLTLIQEISERLRDFNHQYVEKVLQAERMAVVGRFASSIIHDLKNPLTIISMAAQSACREKATQETRQTALERITKQVDRITNLVNDILEFTRGPQGIPAVCAVEYDEYVQRLAEDFRLDLAPKRVTLEMVNPPPAVKPLLNPKRLSRVFYNLIHNAVDAMPEGGVIHLRFQVGQGELLTEVSDTGPGIAPEILPEIFDAFATFGKAKGTGLGLAISQRIVEEHGGKISARNGQERGAIFSFTLPLSP